MFDTQARQLNVSSIPAGNPVTLNYCEQLNNQASESTPKSSRKTDLFEAPDNSANTRKRKSGFTKLQQIKSKKRKRGSKCALEKGFPGNNHTTDLKPPQKCTNHDILLWAFHLRNRSKNRSSDIKSWNFFSYF